MMTSTKPQGLVDSSELYFLYEQKIEVSEMIFVCCVVASMISIFWISVAFASPENFIKVTLVFVLLTNVLSTCLFFMIAHYRTALLFNILSIASFWYSGIIQRKVSFSSTLTKFAMGIINVYPATVVFALAFSFIQVLWLIVWNYLVVNLLSRGNILSNLEVFLLLCSLFWTTQIVKNTVHVTTSGSVSVWYFMKETGLPTNPTLNSFARSVSSYFGSICLGSLLISPFETIRSFLNLLRPSNRKQRNGSMSTMIENFDESTSFLNRFALSHIAIYGKSFVEAGRDSWLLLRSRGVDLLLDADITNSTFTLACYASGLLTGLCGALWASQHEHIHISTVFILCFNVGYCINLVVLEFLSSAISTIFVCYAEEPEILSRNDPVIFSRIRELCSMSRGQLSSDY
eukprot:c20266_g1_i4.p1 GENE.c20266_g1_i4~~c20266_g1_i4.p1  ORF type:complete len:402 (+),score=132.19 c20266_g1_i4:298-1503(+)